jgi:general secretion pathway protein G
MSRGDVGTTLLEVLVVLVILGFVAQVTVPRVYFILANAKGKLAMQQVDALGNALEVYRLDVGELPTSQQGLAALVTRPNETVEWNGPYPKSNLVPKDPWVI